jgi:hypothetical protein
MRLSRHAQSRSIQRSLPLDVLKVIHAYGSPCHSRGALSLQLDKETIHLAAENNRRKRAKLERYRGTYIIIGTDDIVVTAVRRTRHYRRH